MGKQVIGVILIVLFYSHASGEHSKLQPLALASS